MSDEAATAARWPRPDGNDTGPGDAQPAPAPRPAADAGSQLREGRAAGDAVSPTRPRLDFGTRVATAAAKERGPHQQASPPETREEPPRPYPGVGPARPYTGEGPARPRPDEGPARAQDKPAQAIRPRPRRGTPPVQAAAAPASDANEPHDDRSLADRLAALERRVQMALEVFGMVPRRIEERLIGFEQDLRLLNDQVMHLTVALDADRLAEVVAPVTTQLGELAGQVDAVGEQLTPVTTQLDELAGQVAAVGEQLTRLDRASALASAAMPPPPTSSPVRELTERLEQRLASLAVEVSNLAAEMASRADAESSAPEPRPATSADVAGPSAARAELVSWVLEVEGIGPTRAESLADAFGDLDRLAVATIEDIVTLTGLAEPHARRVRDYVRAWLETAAP